MINVTILTGLEHRQDWLRAYEVRTVAAVPHSYVFT